MSSQHGSIALRSRSQLVRKLGLQKLEPRICLTVPAFSSLPGADHTIFLDFDGETVSNTSWNSYYNQSSLVAQPYDIDGNPSSFNSTELARIEESWKRTAEDFRPFNINVTTVDPGEDALRKSGSTDTQWGVRVIVTRESTMVTNSNERCGCGGIAYIDSFNWSSDTPVWVYTTGGKSVAEAASHEVGHSLGLSHDGLTTGAAYYQGHGDGETGWASIMGVGYYENVTQWDKGEYYNANNGGSNANYGDGPDDLALIVGQAGPGNGFSYRDDDHGNGNASASTLAPAGTTLTGEGVIETTGDVDVFRFSTGSGNVSISIDPFTPGPNLDVRAELFDSNGSLVAVSDSASVLSAGFDLNLNGGEYYLHVDGTGWGSPGANPPQGYSDYASLGMYTISGTIVDTGTEPIVTVNDTSIAEDGGTAVFELSLSKASSASTTVNWATASGSATDQVDYVGASGTVTFAPGQTTSTVSVGIIDDSATESDETFGLILSSPVGLILGDSQGTATIIDNDAAVPSVSISNASVQEGKENTKGKNAGTRQRVDMLFTVSLSTPYSNSVAVNYSTNDDLSAANDRRATADDDYLAISSGQVTFAPGETTRTIVVTVLGDNVVENDESFLVELSSATNAVVGDGIGVGTIVNDDSSGGKGGKGGGNGGGKPAKISSGEVRDSELNPIAIVDEIWMFEGPDGIETEPTHHHHGHLHSHGEGHGMCGCDQCVGMIMSLATNKTLVETPDSFSSNGENAPTTTLDQAEMAATLLWDLNSGTQRSRDVDFILSAETSDESILNKEVERPQFASPEDPVEASQGDQWISAFQNAEASLEADAEPLTTELTEELKKPQAL